MKYVAICAAGACLLAMTTFAGAAPAAQTNVSPVQLAQLTPAKEKADKPKPKKESSLKQRVKRAWKDLTGYKFNVSCFGTKSTCTESGKSRDEARSKCQSQHMLCLVTDR